MLLNADEAHSSKSVGTEYRVVQIHPEELNRIGREVGTSKNEACRFSYPVLRNPLLFRSLVSLHLELELHASSLELESKLNWTVALLLRRHRKDRSSSEPARRVALRVRMVQDYLRNHLNENTSLTDLASIAKMSPYHLIRVFARQIGVPPHEYQTQLRVARAKRLLETGREISHVALDTGFFDQSHLTRNFKRIVGVPPGTYLSRRNIVQD